MNRQIVKLFGLVVVLFAVLIGFTSYWAVFDAASLKGKDANKRPLLEQQQIKRGRILAADGTVIARSVPKGQRRRPALRAPLPRRARSTATRSATASSSRATASSSSSTTTSWSATNRNSARSSTSCAGAKQEGNDVVTNLDPAAQATALEDLREAGYGAVVAIEPQSGRVLVMASNPPYDPNRVPYEYSKLNTNEIETPLFNRATQGQYPPGSTFKVVTAAAGLESGAITPETPIDAPGSLEVEGHAARKRLRRRLPRGDPGHRADQLGQHLVRPARPAAGQRHAVRIHGTFRLQLDPGDRPSRRRGLQERRLRRRTANCSAPTTRSTWPGWRSARSGWR